MATTPAVSIAAQNLQNAAFGRLTKAILRRRTVTLFITAVERDYTNSNLELAKRSKRVLEYMRGYIEAVNTEVVQAQDEYDLQTYKVVRRRRLQANKA